MIDTLSLILMHGLLILLFLRVTATPDPELDKPRPPMVAPRQPEPPAN